MRNSIKKHFNVGWLIERCRFSRRERAFAETWIRTNRTEQGWHSYHSDLIAKLFIIDRDISSIFGKTRKLTLTARDRFIVATVIQWLGTNIGWHFLESALKRAGFQLIPLSDNPDREYFQPFDQKKRDGSAWNNLMARYEHRLSMLPERQMTPAFRKKHLIRHRNIESDYRDICIRCGWIKTSDFNQREESCLWDQKSIDRRRENQSIIDRPDIMPFCKIIEQRGNRYVVKLTRAMRPEKVMALAGDVIRLNGFSKRVIAVDLIQLTPTFHDTFIATVSDDPPYGPKS